MDALAAFLKPGLAVAAGSQALARNLAAAVLLTGLAVPPVLALATAPAAAAPQSVPYVADADGGELKGALRDMLAPYAGAAVRHGLDPETFVSAVAILKGDREDAVADCSRIALAPFTGRKGETVRTVDPSANRWLDLMRRHGRAAGAGQAVDLLSAASSVEDGKRRKPLVESTVQRLFEMRGNANLEAEVLAREVAEVTAAVGALNATETYVLVAYGVEGLSGLTKAVRAQHGKPGGGGAAHKALGVAAGSSDLLRVPAEGKPRPATAAEFVGRLDASVDEVRDVVRSIIERTSAALDEPAPPALG